MVRDQRGIVAPPSLTWNGGKLAFQPGSNLPGNGAAAGMHAKLPDLALDAEARLPFAFELELNGMRAMNFALLSEDTSVQLAADWPNPSFSGELLPVKRDITAAGFTAQWRASSFSFNVSWRAGTMPQG